MILPETPLELRREVDAYRASHGSLDGLLHALAHSLARARDFAVAIGDDLAIALENALDRSYPAIARNLNSALAGDLAVVGGRALADASVTADLLGRALDQELERDRVLALAGRLSDLLRSEPMHTPTEGLFDWFGTIIYGFVVLWATDPIDEALQSEVEPSSIVQSTVLVDSLAGDRVRLRATVGAAEELVQDLVRLGDRLYDAGAVEEAAVVDRQAEAIRALANSGAPPPRSFNAAMLDGHELLREHTSAGDLAESLMEGGLTPDEAAVAAAELDRLAASFEMPENDDGAGYSHALAELSRFGEALIEAEAKKDPSRLQALTREGLQDGYKKLLAAVVVGSPYGLYRALNWLTEHHSWLSAMYRFAVGIVRATNAL